MRELMFLILLVGLWSQTIAHEGHQAFYKLTSDNGMVVLTSKLEIPDVETCLAERNNCAVDQDFSWCAGTWLVDQISITINGNLNSLTLETSVTEDGHVIFTHSLGMAPSEITSIEFKNAAFIDTFPDYQNIFQNFLGEQQGYKMSQERSTITIQLNQP